MDVSENVTVKEYFEEHVPKLFEEQLANTPVSGMEGTVFTVQFDIVGDEKQSYGMIVKDAKDLEISAGPLEEAMVKLEMSEDLWRKGVTGKMEGAVDMFTDMGQMANRKSYDVLQSTKGAMNLALDMPDGSLAKIKITFNGGETPQATFKAALEDWVKVSTGELPGPTAFMSGKLKIEGDMPFAMSLSNLMS